MKCKNILVKKLRKAGYSNAEAMRIAKAAYIEYRLHYNRDSFNSCVMRSGVRGLFIWHESKHGLKYWSDINAKLQEAIIMKYQVQYSVHGSWVNGNIFSTHKEAEAYAKKIMHDYQIKKIK